MEGRKIKMDYLDTPIKSENDNKEYRVVKLENGLTALLISNFNFVKSKENKDNKNKKSANDEFIHDKTNYEFERKMAACALRINVGSFSDPPEVPGLAHFLEHVISVGSEKYPQENEYENFVKGKGGSIHADTGCERTKYVFQIDPEYLLPAMERFADLFVKPLMKESAILRERESVDNEYHLDSSSDYERLKQFFRVIPRKDHPAAKFSCGNLITLHENIAEDLRAFKEMHYSARRMTLAVQATLPLDTLEEYVKSCFSNIPSKFVLPDDFTAFSGVDSFDCTKFRKIYKIKSVNDTSEMEIKWIMPPSRHLYKSKPINYISYIINHEGTNSLSHYLREKKLCHRVSVTTEEYSIYSVFTLNLVLSQNWNNVIKNTLEAVFSFINILRSNGPQKRIFDEMQKIAETKFRFADEISAAANVQELCNSMNLYFPTEYITGSKLYFEYNPKSIQRFLDHLTMKNVFIILMDKAFDEEKFDQIEPWYHIRYSISDIPEDWIADLQEMDPFQEFDFPGRNVFVATDFYMVNQPDDVPEYPVKIEHNGKIEIWYKPDLKFQLPKCFVYLQFITACSIQSLHSSVLLRLFTILLHELVLLDAYDGKCAGLDYNISVNEKGICIKVNGFSQKVPLLLKMLMKYIADFSKLVTEDLFNLVKMELLKYYSRTLYDPGNLANEIKLSLVKSNFWMSTDKFVALNDINFDRFVDFTKQFTDQIFIQSLVQGNVTHNDAIKIIRDSTLPLKHSLLYIPPNDSMYPKYYKQLPLIEKCYWIKNLNPRDINSVVMNYYKTNTELSKMSLPVFNEFLEMIIQQPLFHQLRTEEQLGYSVSCSASVDGFNIIIYSPAHKFTIEYIDQRIENFLKHFVSTLKQMSEHDFNNKKERFKRLKNYGDISIKNEVERNWFAITSEIFIFNENEQQISIINSLTLDEFRQWMENHTVGGKNCQKLSVQVAGNVDSKITEDKTNKQSLKILNDKIRKIQLN